MTSREQVVAAVGDSIPCPGCGEHLTLDWADGWRNDSGFTCTPTGTVHSDHIETIKIGATS